MYGSHSSYCMRLESSLSLYQCTQLPVCTVATVQLLYAIGIHTVTISAQLPICTVATVRLLYVIGILTVISVHTVTNMYGSHSTVIICDWNPHCHISAQLPICTVATVQFLYAIGIHTVTISVHTVNQYVR